MPSKFFGADAITCHIFSIYFSPSCFLALHLKCTWFYMNSSRKLWLNEQPAVAGFKSYT